MHTHTHTHTRATIASQAESTLHGQLARLAGVDGKLGVPTLSGLGIVRVGEKKRYVQYAHMWASAVVQEGVKNKTMVK